MINVLAFLVGLTLPVIGIFSTNIFSQEDTLGSGGAGALWYITSGQLRPVSATVGLRVPSLASEDCLGTDADGDFQAGVCGGEASNFWNDAGSYIYPKAGDYISGPYVVATSTTASSFPYASSTAITATNFWGLASLATALNANGGNCSAGNAPLGVDASGAVESCFDVWTEAENTSAAYLSSVDISANTNLAASFPITLTGDTLSWSGLATSSALSQGELVYATGGKTLASVATGTLTETTTGLELDATRGLVGGSAILSLTSGYAIPSTTRLAEHDTAYSWGNHALQSYITDGNTNWDNSYGFVTEGQTVGTSTAGVAGELSYWTGIRTLGSVATGTLTESILGIDIDNSTRGLVGGSAALSLTSGYTIPSTTRALEWDTAYGWGNDLSTTTPWTTGELARVASDGTVKSIATSSLNINTDNLVEGATNLFNQTHTGDVTGSVALSIANDKVTPDDVLSTGQTDEYCLTYEQTGDTWEWATCGTGVGGGGVWATTTDANPEAAETVLYTPDDVYIGGSASTSAEFNFDVESATLTIATSTTASATIAATNDALQLLGSSTRGVEFDYKSPTNFISRLVGSFTDWLFPNPVTFQATTTHATSTFALASTSDLIADQSVNLFGGGAKTTANALCVQLTGHADLCDGGDATGSGVTYLASTTPWTTGQGYLATVISDGALSSVATGTLSESVTGLSLDATRALVGGSAALSLDSGYVIPTTTRALEWDTAYSSIYTDADVSSYLYGSTTRSDLYGAGDALTWSSNTLNFDGGASPAGALGGTWASPSVDDDGHAHTGTTLSGIDISSDTNLTADGTEIILTDDALSLGTTLTFNYGSTTGFTSTNLHSNVASTTYASTTVLTLHSGLDIFGGGVKTTANALCIQLTGSADLCDGSDGGGAGGDLISTSTIPVAGNLTYWTAYNTVSDVATGTLSESVTGLSLDATRGLVGGAAALSLDSGYVIPTTTRAVEWDTAYSSIYTDGDVSSYLYGSTTRADLYTAGDGLTWSATTLNFDGGDTPGGSLGGTWASPTIDDLFLLNNADDTTSGKLTATGGFVSPASSTISDLTMTNATATASFRLIGDLITDVAAWFSTKLNAVTSFVAVAASTWDFGGAASLELPNAAAPTVDAAGEIAYDTTDEQLIVGASANVVPTQNVKIWSTTIASTSPAFISSGLLKVPTMLDGYTMTAIRCSVQGGTSKVIAVEDESTNSTEDITCATSVTSDDGSITNASVTAAEEMYIDFGATSGSVDYVSISVFGDWTRE